MLFFLFICVRNLLISHFANLCVIFLFLFRNDGLLSSQVVDFGGALLILDPIVYGFIRFVPVPVFVIKMYLLHSLVLIFRLAFVSSFGDFN